MGAAMLFSNAALALCAFTPPKPQCNLLSWLTLLAFLVNSLGLLALLVVLVVLALESG